MLSETPERETEAVLLNAPCERAPLRRGLGLRIYKFI